MSITDPRRLNQITKTIEEGLNKAQSEFNLRMDAIKKERAQVLSEARRALEKQSIEKLSHGIHDGK